MNELSDLKNPSKVQDMFARIAPRYDLMNRIMTGWQDQSWREFTIQKTKLDDRDLLLDLGSGTGDLAGEALRQHPEIDLVAVDFTLPMMFVGQDRYPEEEFNWAAGDSLQLPFPDNTFNAVVSGFLLRNLADLHQGLIEQYRILKPGGKFVSLDTTQPPNNFLSPLITFYLHSIIPLLGKMITGQEDAYRYLPSSTDSFLRAEELTAHLAAVGFRKIMYRRFMFGMIAVHWGEK